MKLPTRSATQHTKRYGIYALGNWCQGIFNWVRFVHFRRPDTRHGMLGNPSTFVFALVLLAALIYAVVIFVDRPYLSWLRSPDFETTQLFQIITRFGSVTWILAVSGIVMVVLSLLTADRFQKAEHLLWHRLFLNAYYLFTGIAFSGLLGNLLKNAIGRARPPFTPEGYTWFSMPFEDRYQFAAFPSGHSTTGGAIAVGLALLFPRWRWFFLIAGALIALSRPMLGVHFPSDAIAGFAFGGFFVWFYARSFARKRLLFCFDDAGKLRLRGENNVSFSQIRALMARPGK